MIYIGAEVIISPLGDTPEQNWEALLANRSGITFADGAGIAQEGLYLAAMCEFTAENRFEKLVLNALAQIRDKIDPAILKSPQTIVLLSSTKGALDVNVHDQFGGTVSALQEAFQLANQPIVVSNACISGVLAINTGANLIRQGIYEHAVVIGCDVISDFVINGFQALFAVSDQPCAPFDADRKGITLGEGCGAVVISGNAQIFTEFPLQLLTGNGANDANHISGPSRTGEGLFRSVQKTLRNNNVSVSEIDFICSHGTATIFNDEMESIAFDRLGMNAIPLNSLKGYFGHTLGAAGLIETVACALALKHDMLIKNLNYTHSGVSKPLNIIEENQSKPLTTILKTASGFGGGNAALILRKI